MSSRNHLLFVLALGSVGILMAASPGTARSQDANPSYKELERIQGQEVSLKRRTALAKAIADARQAGVPVAANGDFDAGSAGTSTSEPLPTVFAVEGDPKRPVARILYANNAVDNHVVAGSTLQNGLVATMVTPSGVQVRRASGGAPVMLPWSGSAPLMPQSAGPTQPSFAAPPFMGAPMAPGAIQAPGVRN